MERIRRKELWIVELLAHPKPRPAIVVSIDPINDLCPDVILIPVTTKPGPLRIPLPENEWPMIENGIKRALGLE